MNIPEVLVANCTGATIAIFVFLLRVRNSETKLRRDSGCSAGGTGDGDHQLFD